MPRYRRTNLQQRQSPRAISLSSLRSSTRTLCVCQFHASRSARLHLQICSLLFRSGQLHCSFRPFEGPSSERLRHEFKSLRSGQSGREVSKLNDRSVQPNRIINLSNRNRRERNRFSFSTQSVTAAAAGQWQRSRSIASRRTVYNSNNEMVDREM